MTAPSCTCRRCHHCDRLLAVDEHSAVCGNGQCPREDTDIDEDPADPFAEQPRDNSRDGDLP